MDYWLVMSLEMAYFHSEIEAQAMDVRLDIGTFDLNETSALREPLELCHDG